MNNIKVGIEKISLYVPKSYIDVAKLAETRGVDPNKWTIGIGQIKMSLIDKYQDIVTMGANAASQILSDIDKEEIAQVIFATESGFDYSKASSTYIHELLSINKYAKSYEIKQACYSTTAALQIASDHVRLRPQEKILIISSDIAKYGPNTGGEVTQGAGAIAILISSQPKILEITDQSSSITVNAYDFWRPSYSEVPMVDGKYSTQIYIDIFKDLINRFDEKYKDLDQVDAFLFHLPFAKMGKKALIGYKTELEEDNRDLTNVDRWLEKYEPTTILCRQIGNLYTGSLYLSLISYLAYGQVQPGQKLGLFSYGSGSVAEIFTAIVGQDFQDNIDIKFIEDMLDKRDEVSPMTYDQTYFDNMYTEKKDASNLTPENFTGYYLEKVEEDKRTYGFKK